jgi:hypothetical protein
MRPGRLSNRNCELRFAAPRRPFKQQRLLQLSRQKDNPGHYRVDEVPGRFEPFHQIVERFKHPASSITGDRIFQVANSVKFPECVRPRNDSGAKQAIEIVR